MIYRIAWTGGKFPHVVGDLDGETVVQVASDYEELFRGPFRAVFDKFFAFFEENGPGFIFRIRILVRSTAGSYVRNYKVNR